jgi:RNA polymerase sigma factor (sigma-70 family)
MQATDDLALLREYAARDSEDTFAELVSRRVNFVYSAALRQVRNPHLAEEITQAVFVILAQKAEKISDKTILTGWLFKTTRFAALAQIRAESKRVRQQKEFQMQSQLEQTSDDLSRRSEAEADEIWNQMSPLLDEALATLGEKDRQAVLLRFFENKSLAEVGNFLGMGEDTARKRISRALEKLRRYFNRHGISSTTAIIAGTISANSIQAAPIALAKSVTVVAIAKGAAASTSTLTLIKGALKIMAWTKAKTAILICAGVLLATSTTATLWHFEKDSWRNQFEAAYKLKNGEVLRYIPPPFIPERAEYYHTEKALHRQAELIPNPPDFFIFKQDKNERLNFASCGFGYKRHTLQQMLTDILGFRRYEFDAPDGLLQLNLTGDWTIRDGVNREDLLAALEPIILKATGRKIHFEKRTVEREVIVARGRSGINWQNVVQIYAENPKGSYGRGFGKLQQLLGTLGDQLNIYVVNETQTNTLLGDQFEWHYYSDSDYSKMGNRRAELTEKVLKNVAAQTGLSFTHEQRPVEIWFVTERPAK